MKYILGIVATVAVILTSMLVYFYTYICSGHPHGMC